MSAKDKKYRILEKKLREMGYSDNETIDKVINELNEVANICIDAFITKQNKEVDEKGNYLLQSINN